MATTMPFGKSFRDSLKLRSVKMVGLATVAVGALATRVAAETFNFSILTDLADAVIALIPKANAVVQAGGPLVINVCIIGAICAPFIALYVWAHKL